MGFFDPLGLLTPFTIHGKLVIQDLWRSGCDWDERIDDDTLAKWDRWTKLLPMVTEIRIPRCYFPGIRSSSIESLELHIFTDASTNTYGCAAYFRAVVDGNVRCALVMSRSKVAPLKLQSVPRLELMAAVLGARMLQTVRTSHTLPITRQVLWSDSQTVLSWIRSDQHKYKQFVAFRIGEIVELTSSSDWRYVPSEKNIADVVTKWGAGPPLTSNGPWFIGPEFLYEPESMWPKQEKKNIDVPEEMKGSVLFHDAFFSSSLINVQVTAQWGRLIRIAATVVRFINNCRRKVKGDPILVSKAGSLLERFLKGNPRCILQPLRQEELQEGERILFKQAQQDSFPEEVKILQVKRDANPATQVAKSSWLYTLNPFIDANGVVRMDGRLSLSELASFDKKFPVILPRRHDITKMIIRSYHEKFGHANRETVFNELRQRFYISKLRPVIKSVADGCIWCRVHRSQPKIPMMAPVSVQRSTPPLRPFCSVGIDYFGPVEVTVGRRSEKRWIALFTCLAVRAVHLEVVHSLSAQACLMAIRRFICRRGSPDEFFSDNGTNFKGASKEMINMAGNISMECAENIISPTIKWHFIPPATPHMGGVWERMVRSVKEAMKALDDGRKLTDEILLTTLCEAEDMINSRPLTYSSQESEVEAITPNHFLRSAVKEADSAVEQVGISESLRDLHKRSQYLADRMWQRWSKEYLPGINRRTKWHAEQRVLRVGDLVFIVDGDQRKNWIRGVIEEVIEGADGKVRQAMVRTTRGVTRKAVANLAVFEIDGKTGTGEVEPELRAGV